MVEIDDCRIEPKYTFAITFVASMIGRIQARRTKLGGGMYVLVSARAYMFSLKRLIAKHIM